MLAKCGGKPYAATETTKKDHQNRHAEKKSFTFLSNFGHAGMTPVDPLFVAAQPRPAACRLRMILMAASDEEAADHLLGFPRIDVIARPVMPSPAGNLGTNAFRVASIAVLSPLSERGEGQHPSRRNRRTSRQLGQRPVRNQTSISVMWLVTKERPFRDSQGNASRSALHKPRSY